MPFFPLPENLENREDPSKTELPTEKRLQEARNKDGNVLVSQDITSFFVLLGCSLLFLVTVPWMYDEFRNIFLLIGQLDCRDTWNNENLIYGAEYAIKILFINALPIMICACLSAIIILRIQVGAYFSFAPLRPKLNILNPVSGIKNLLPSKRNFIRLLLTIGKVSIIAFVIYFSTRDDFDKFLQLPMLPLMASMIWMLKKIFWILMKVIVIFFIIAVLDFIYKRREYYSKLMMTKQEVKDERRMEEGDPKVKAKIRKKMAELLFSQMMRRVPEADVVITNPIHVAVALKYEIGKPAPEVVAKGLRKRAQRIKEIAKQHDIPIVEAPPLARSLYRHVNPGNFIPHQFFKAVAAILAQLQREKRKKFI